MGWFGYGIYCGDGTQSLHYDLTSAQAMGL